MGIRGQLAFNGNVKRILELKAAGFGDNATAGVMADNGVPMTAEQVKVIGEVYIPMSAKAVPKRVVKRAIAGKQQVGFGGGMVPKPA
mgnify:CR=1 FL=1